MPRKKKSPQNAIPLGIFLMVVGAPIWQIGQFLSNGPTTLIGVLLFFGGVISFLVGIADLFGVDI